MQEISGYAKFCGHKQVEVNGEVYTADHILIATGGYPIIPNKPGIVGCNHNNDTILY